MTSIAIEDAEGEIPIGTTGGVSYNSSIVRMIDGFVRENGLELLTHDEIPNGDNGISIGQNVICGIDMMDGVV
jgi:hydrogenase maturation protein HypF